MGYFEEVQENRKSLFSNIAYKKWMITNYDLTITKTKNATRESGIVIFPKLLQKKSGNPVSAAPPAYIEVEATPGLTYR